MLFERAKKESNQSGLEAKMMITLNNCSTGNHKGVFFAIRDVGACIRIKNFNVNYRYCPERVFNAVRFVLFI